MFDRQRMLRSAVKAALRPVLRWKPLDNPLPGYSIVLGTPWALRHLLTLNLRFIARTDQANLHRIYVVFDRLRQPGADEFISSVRDGHSELPIEFLFQPKAAGRIIARVNRSKFYASLNWVTGIKECKTRFAIMHDFDLYPLDPTYFEKIHLALRERDLRFSGAEFTHFDGLKDEDGLIGTWSLAIDVKWLRENHRPVDCFHEVMPVNGRRVDLDAFSAIQSRTPERALAEGVGPESFVHVRNLVSTYLLFSEDQPAKIAWRLHHLWYLESLLDPPRDLEPITCAMNEANGPAYGVDGKPIDMSGVHHTCANVLTRELVRTEEALFGAVRPHVRSYLGALEGHLLRIQPRTVE